MKAYWVNTELSQKGDYMRRKPLVFKQLDSGCIIPTSHKLNQDGYFRAHDPRYKGKGRSPLIMYHKYIWELKYGEVPEGYSIHHICHNRACCNIEHLQLIKKSDHAIEHNSTRYADRQQAAKEYWLSHEGTTGIALAEQFGVSFSTANKWIRKWKVQRLSDKE